MTATKEEITAAVGCPFCKARKGRVCRGGSLHVQRAALYFKKKRGGKL